MVRFVLLMSLLLNVCVLSAFEGEYAFTIDQEKALSKNTRALAFLYHMTRNDLTFSQMAEKYSLESVDYYRDYFFANDLIADSLSDEAEYLFTNPKGAWHFRNEGNCPIMKASKKRALRRIEKMLSDKKYRNRKGEGPSSQWTANTYRLTEEQYQDYKEELLDLCGEYLALSEKNLEAGTECSVVWSMQLSGEVKEELANRDHLLFGEVKEYPTDD